VVYIDSEAKAVASSSEREQGSKIFPVGDQQFIQASQSEQNIHRIPEKENDNVLYMTLTNLGIFLKFWFIFTKLQETIYSNM